MDKVINFIKDMSMKKKIIIVGVALAIIVLLLLLGRTPKAKTIESDNFYGMRFNLTISNFCEIYNANLKQALKEMGQDVDSDSVYFLSDTYFKKSNTKHSQSNLDMYITSIDTQGAKTSFVLYVEPDNDYIVGANIMADSNYYNSNNSFNEAYCIIVTRCFTVSLVQTLYPNATDSNSRQMFSNCTETNHFAYYKDNIVFSMISNTTSNTSDFMIMAMSENKYKELYTSKSTTTNNNSTNTNYNQNTNNNFENSDTDYNISQNSTTNQTTTSNNNNQTNTSVEQFNKDNEKAYTKYCLLFENGEIYEDIYIELEGRNIYLYNKDSETSYTGTYTSSNGYLVGKYTEVSYNNGGDIERETINDSFKFEILPNHKLRDVLGYGQWCGQIFGQDTTYTLY